MTKSYKQGDIVFVKYPFTNLVEFKVRPALILRDQDDDDVIVMAISTTTNLRSCDLVIKNAYYCGQPLPVKSAIRMGKITALKSDLIVALFTRLQEEYFRQVQKALFRYLK